jgi:integrase
MANIEKWVQNTESAIRDGRHFKAPESQKHTLAELIDRYIDNVLPLKPKSQAKQTAQLNWWKQEIGSYVLANITPSLIAECRDKLLNTQTMRKEKMNPATVVRYLAALSHAFTVAVNEWGWLEDSPMRKVNKPKESRGRVRFLSDKERDALLENCKKSDNKYLNVIVVLALSTGMRKGEILNLTWENVDLQRDRITLHETKNGERRVVPLVSRASELLKELNKIRIIGTTLLFPSGIQRNGTLRNPPSYKPIHIRKAWLTALNKAEIEDFRFHDLRHSAASYLAMNGASLAEIAEVLGHKTLQMVKRYAHLSEAHTADVVERMNNKIFG